MPKRKDDIELPKHFYSYCRVCIDMERNGLNCFDKEGNYGRRDGEIIILGMLIIFERVEMYKECAFLRDFLIGCRNKFRSTREATTEECNQPSLQVLKLLLS